MKNKKKGEKNEKRKETVRSEQNWGEKKEVKNNEERKGKGMEGRKKERSKEWGGKKGKD